MQDELKGPWTTWRETGVSSAAATYYEQRDLDPSGKQPKETLEERSRGRTIGARFDRLTGRGSGKNILLTLASDGKKGAPQGSTKQTGYV